LQIAEKEERKKAERKKEEGKKEAGKCNFCGKKICDKNENLIDNINNNIEKIKKKSIIHL